MSADRERTIRFINGKIWQENGQFINSFSIRGNKIVSAGKETGTKPGNPHEEIIDLKSSLVLPAFTDGHVHLVYGSVIRKRLDCSQIENKDELRKLILTYAGKHPGLQWLQGGNLHIEKVFPGMRNSQSNLMDGVFDSKPIFLSNYDYHSAICNTKAMQESGLLSHLDEFKPEELLRNGNGEPIGIIMENARDFLLEHIPEASIEEKTGSVSEMIGIMHSLGITSVSDITVAGNFDVYNKLYESGKLNVRINSYIPMEHYNKLAHYQSMTSNIPEEIFCIKGFKGFYDGALGSGTAYFKENYRNSSNRGLMTEIAESGMLSKLAQKIDKAGKQIIIHAIGDQAVSDVLDICETLVKTNGYRDRRFRIEHAQHIDENDFERFEELKIIASVQPLHLKYDAKIVLDKLFEKFAKRTHNYKQLLDRGVVLNFGTDFPIVEIDPFKTIQTAVTRNLDGLEFYPENKINLHECIKAYTINNAYASFNEKVSGSIEEGKYADFIIMKDDLFSMNENDISEAKVLKTYFNGVEVYSSGEL